jgi:hypothetical protein
MFNIGWFVVHATRYTQDWDDPMSPKQIESWTSKGAGVDMSVERLVVVSIFLSAIISAWPIYDFVDLTIAAVVAIASVGILAVIARAIIRSHSFTDPTGVVRTERGCHQFIAVIAVLWVVLLLLGAHLIFGWTPVLCNEPIAHTEIVRSGDFCF